jgi:hypothetical protein
VFRRVAEHGGDFPMAAADFEHVAVHDAFCCVRQCRHASLEGIAPCRLCFHSRGVQAVAFEQCDAAGPSPAAHAFAHRVRAQDFGFGDVDGRAGPRREPARAADVIGVIVRDDDACHAPTRHRGGEMLFPDVPGGFDAVARVDDAPAVAVFQQPEVDVIQRKRQRHAQPVNAGCDFDGGAGRGEFCERVGDHVAR